MSKSVSVSNVVKREKKQGVVTRDVYDSAMSTYQGLVKSGAVSKEIGQQLIDEYAANHRVKGTRGESNLAILTDLPSVANMMQQATALLVKVNAQLAKDKTRMQKVTKANQPKMVGLPQVGLKVEITNAVEVKDKA